MKLDNNDKIVGVKICQDDQDVILSTKFGKCIRFEAKKLRVFKGRSSKGIKGIELAPNDQIVSLSVIDNDKTKKNGKNSDDKKAELIAGEKFILSITENGYGKRTKIDEFSLQKRSGKGNIAVKTSERNGKVIGALKVKENDDLMLITDHGTLVRTSIKDIRQLGRNTQGVKLQKLGKNEKLSQIEKVEEDKVEET